MRLHCLVPQHLVRYHLLPLLHLQHEVSQLPYNDGVLPKQACVDDLGPHMLDLGL